MKLPAQWEHLAAREKNIIIAGGIILVGIIAYLFLAQPFFTAINDLEDQIDNKREIISWLQPAAQQIQQYSRQGYTQIQPLSGSLLEKIDNTLKAHQLNHFVKQTTVIDANQVNIIFNTVPFDAAMDWLTALWLAGDIQVTQAAISPAKTSGLVSMNITLIKYSHS